MQVKSIDSHYQIGRTCTLEVLRLVSIGAYLEWSDEAGVLLPLRYMPEGLAVGDQVEVFVYHDNEGRPIATTMKPIAEVGQTALMECVSLSSSGAFMGWGIHKDLFVPYAEQRGRMQEGRYYIVHLYIDHLSGKIVGSAKLNKHIGNTLPSYRPGEEVSALIAETNDVGYRAIVNHRHWGIIYASDVDEDLRHGDMLTAYIHRVREDGRLDLGLRPVGYDRVEGDATRLVRLMRGNKGILAVGDKSPAEEVMRLTGLSKKSFKMAVGSLYREQRVRLTPTSVTLIEYMEDTDR